MIPLKNQKDLEMLRRSGAILAEVLERLRAAVKPGVATEAIDRLAEDLVRQRGALAAFKGYRGFPASICVSIDEEIVHGIPSARTIREGEIVSLDLGINYEGYFTDAAITVGAGKVDPRKKGLMEATRRALAEGIRQARVGARLSDISAAVQGYVERQGFSVVRDFVGHGIGVSLHEEPEIPNFGQPGRGPRLESGMVLAIEPMVNMGSWEARVQPNGWTAVAKDGLPSAHFEHTVAVTREGPEILTRGYERRAD